MVDINNEIQLPGLVLGALGCGHSASQKLYTLAYNSHVSLSYYLL